MKVVNVLILRVKFSKKNYLKYISHLDLVRLFDKAFRIIDLPIRYSQGYNPRQKFSIAAPLPLGMEGYGEYMDIDLESEIDIVEFLKKINMELPEDIEFLEAEFVEDKKSIGYYIEWADYIINFSIDKKIDEIEFNNIIERFLQEESIMVIKTKEKKRKLLKWKENIVSSIKYIKLLEIENNNISISTRLKTNLGNVKPEEFLKVFLEYAKLELVEDSVDIIRTELLGEDNKEIISIFKGE